jgi:regulator of sigma E protease
MLITAIVFLLILSVLVLIHEFGHFWVAKRLGIKVEEFGFGLPLLPAIFKFKRGETLYSVYPALIGGFVKLYGEDEAGAGRVRVTKNEEHGTKNKKEDERRAFYSRSVGQRASVVIAGVVMNAALAVVIFYVFMFISNFKTELPVYPPGLTVPQFLGVNQDVSTQIIIGSVVKDSPAAKAGIKPISQVISINGVEIESMDYFLKTVNANKGKEIVLEMKDLRTDAVSTVTVVPRVDPPKDQGALGVSFFPAETVHMNYESAGQKAMSGISHPVNLMVYNFVALRYLIDDSIERGNVDMLSQGVSGPVGIFNVVGAVVEIPDLQARVLQLLNLAGILSISLAFFNVLPIPGLDGGRLFFILGEGLFGWKLSPKVEGYINAAGMAFLIALILLITYKDVVQLIGR